MALYKFDFMFMFMFTTLHRNLILAAVYCVGT